MGKFQDQIRRFVLQKQVDRDDAIRKILFDLSRIVLERSPVDTGRFRANWQYGYGVVPNGELNAFDLSDEGSATVDNIIGQVDKGAGKHYLVNNLVYATVIEYGMYPSPPKQGTYVPAGKAKYGITGPGYAQRSEGGFSRQAPAGVVRAAVAEIAQQLGNVATEL